MPEKETLRRARKDKAEGKAASTQAGEFVREEIRHVREGKHGARNAKQAIAIGLSKARRAGVKLSPPKKGEASEKTRKQAKRETSGAKKSTSGKPSPKRAAASEKALKREGKSAASTKALSKQGRSAARDRSPSDRSAAAKKAAKTKTASERSTAAKKAANTRAKKKS